MYFVTAETTAEEIRAAAAACDRCPIRDTCQPEPHMIARGLVYGHDGKEYAPEEYIAAQPTTRRPGKRKRKRPEVPPRQLLPCGTNAAWVRHVKRGEEPRDCPECLAGRTAHYKAVWAAAKARRQAA
jgi:hypothetical protein